MARVILCDRCGKNTRDDMGKFRIIRSRCKWEQFEIYPTKNPDYTEYLCGDCAKAFRRWMKSKEATCQT